MPVLFCFFKIDFPTVLFRILAQMSRTIFNFHLKSCNNLGMLPKELGWSRVTQDIIDLVTRMAKENDGWGYDWIQGVLAILGYIIAPNTVKNILKSYCIELASDRNKRTLWKTFFKSHWEDMTATSFFTVEIWTAHGLLTYYVLLVV